MCSPSDITDADRGAHTPSGKYLAVKHDSKDNNNFDCYLVDDSLRDVEERDQKKCAPLTKESLQGKKPFSKKQMRNRESATFRRTSTEITTRFSERVSGADF